MRGKLVVRLELVDGTTETFLLPVRSNSEMIDKIRFRELFQSNYLTFSTEDDVLIFPVCSVRSMKISKHSIYGPVEGLDAILPVSTFKNVSRI